MIDRFQGPEGSRRVRTALLEQSVVAHDPAVCEELALTASIKELAAGDLLIAQGSSEMELSFILAGEVVIEINGREVARRKAGEHVGEMGLIDPSARRCATVRALDQTVIAQVEEQAFTHIGGRHPQVWERLALDLSRRLRELAAWIPRANSKPVVFVCSTVESLPVARALQAACQHDPWIVRIWTDGVFGAGKTPIESLSAQVAGLDFGLVVVKGEDLVVSRGATNEAPRDNVVFEVGLLLGALGRERALMVRVGDGADLKLPSDLIGVRALEVPDGRPEDLPSRVGPAVEEFRLHVRRLGCR